MTDVRQAVACRFGLAVRPWLGILRLVGTPLLLADVLGTCPIDLLDFVLASAQHALLSGVRRAVVERSLRRTVSTDVT